jgi:hypothetical protein
VGNKLTGKENGPGDDKTERKKSADTVEKKYVMSNKRIK